MHLSGRKWDLVEIKVATDREGRVVSLSVEGHAGFSDEEHGGDIVCAAVSALVGYLGVTFSEVLPGVAELAADDGYFSFRALEASSSEPSFRPLLEGWLRSVRQLEENYKGWVKLEETTV